LIILKLNLGSGGEPLENYIKVDINPRLTEVDVVCNFDVYPWPFKSESIDKILKYRCLFVKISYIRNESNI